MGSKLRRQLREALPDGIKGLQRAVALEIADDARYNDAGRYDPENGRCSKVRLSDLVRWTTAKDELSVREMLRRLAVAGWEFRVPIGKGKDGRPLYAVPGRAMQFRVPDFQAPTVVGSCEGRESEGPTVVGQGPTTVGEGPTVVAEGPTVVEQDPTVVGSPSQEPPSKSRRYPTSSSAEPVETEPVVEPDVTEGGGGGSSLSRSTAIHIADHLDYRGKPPTKKLRTEIIDRLTAALEAGWSLDGLALYLDLGDAPVDYPAAVYAHRLKPGIIPEPATSDLTLVPGDRHPTAVGVWEQASARVRARLDHKAGWHVGTDEVVAGWVELSRRPAVVDERPPYCGDLECDPVTRLRDVELDGGFRVSERCHKCHPSAVRELASDLRFSA